MGLAVCLLIKDQLAMFHLGETVPVEVQADVLILRLHDRNRNCQSERGRCPILFRTLLKLHQCHLSLETSHHSVYLVHHHQLEIVVGPNFINLQC